VVDQLAQQASRGRRPIDMRVEGEVGHPARIGLIHSNSVSQALEHGPVAGIDRCQVNRKVRAS